MTSATPHPLLTVEQAVALQEASDPRVSPDGRLVAFCAAAVSRTGEHPESTIQVVPTDGSAPPRPFTAGPGQDKQPRWSPDGGSLAFVSDRAKRGTPALYAIPTTGGEAQRVVTERGEVSDPQWSPDGTRLAFLLKEIDSEEEEKRKKEERDDAIVVDEDKYTGLWVVEVASGRARRVSPQGLQVWAHAWSPTGERIAALHTPTPKLNDSYSANTISTFALDAVGEDAFPVEPSTVCHVWGDVSALCWSPDATRLAFCAGEIQRPFTLGAGTAFVVPANGGDPQPALTGHMAELSWVDWLSDRELVAAGVEDLGGAYYRIPLVGAGAGTAIPLFSGEAALKGSPRDLSLGADRTAIVFAREDKTSPGDVWLARPGGDPIRLTTLNPELEGMAWGDVEPVSWTAPDGLEIHGLLIKPVGYQPGTRYPTVVHVHGGPAWLWGDRFYAGWHDWDQFLAGRGYAVLMPNPRGSTGRGTAFMAANVDDVGGGEWQDILAGAHWAIESGIADPERMGIGGWSWGGYLSSWAITQTNLFKAAVVGAGVTNLWSDQGQNDIPDMNRLYFHDLPYSDPTPYWDRSAMRHITRARTPTLILHGQADERVAPPQAQELYRALKTLGVPTQFVLYPREPHSFTERNHQLDLLRRVLAWFDRYLKPGASQPDR